MKTFKLKESNTSVEYFDQNQVVPLISNTPLDERGYIELRAGGEWAGKALFVNSSLTPHIGKDSTGKTIIVFTKN